MTEVRTPIRLGRPAKSCVNGADPALLSRVVQFNESGHAPVQAMALQATTAGGRVCEFFDAGAILC